MAVSWTYRAAESGTLPYSSCSASGGLRSRRSASLTSTRREGTLAVVGRASTEAELLTVPRPLAKRIVDYLSMRGRPPPGAPLFSSCDRAKKGLGALTANGLSRRVKWLAPSAGVLSDEKTDTNNRGDR